MPDTNICNMSKEKKIKESTPKNIICEVFRNYNTKSKEQLFYWIKKIYVHIKTREKFTSIWVANMYWSDRSSCRKGESIIYQSK